MSMTTSDARKRYAERTAKATKPKPLSAAERGLLTEAAFVPVFDRAAVIHRTVEMILEARSAS